MGRPLRSCWGRGTEVVPDAGLLPSGFWGSSDQNGAVYIFAGKVCQKFDQLALSEGKQDRSCPHFGLGAELLAFCTPWWPFLGIRSEAVKRPSGNDPRWLRTVLLSAGGGLLPAVGMAMLMKMCCGTAKSVFLFPGLVLTAYLNLPLVALGGAGHHHCRRQSA